MSAQLIGDKRLVKVLGTLGFKVQQKVTRRAVSLAATPILKAARKRAAKESGLLRKSLGKKVKKYRAVVVGLIGPRKHVVGTHEGKKRWPAKYAHLVEGGHIDEHGNHVPAQPFLRPAFEEKKGEAAAIMGRELAAGIEKEAKKAKGR